MSILDLYDDYHRQHVAKFRSLLDDVGTAVLTTASNYPKKEALEIFKTFSDRTLLYCTENGNSKHCKKSTMQVGFDVGVQYQFPYDDSAARELDKFIEEYYPHINLYHGFTLYLNERRISFTFMLDVDYHGLEDVEARDLFIQFTNSMYLFNDDISELLQDEIDIRSWDELFTSKEYENFYDHGAISFSIELKK